MDTKVIFTNKFRILTFVLMALGAIGIAVGLLTDAHRMWGNLLLGNYYFLSLAIGTAFFFCLQYITQSGWSAMFRRVSEAIMSYIPYAAVVMIIFLFGLNQLYHWSHAEAVASDEMLAHRHPYLNVPFFVARMLIFLGAWTALTLYMRKLSLKEDEGYDLQLFEKMEFWSKVYIFVIAFTFTLASFDWIMSIDAHWFSTIFAFKNFASSFYHGAALVALVVILLHKAGYFPQLNKSHLLDFSRYMFGLSIIYGYLYFAQYMLIWFGNIPEETAYYAKRWDNGWKFFFFFNLAVNWFIPFLGLLPQKLDKSINFVMGICILLMVGQFTDVYEQILPEITTVPKLGIPEIGIFAGMAGLFLFALMRTLSKAPLIPKNHPYLEESIHHHLH